MSLNVVIEAMKESVLEPGTHSVPFETMEFLSAQTRELAKRCSSSAEFDEKLVDFLQWCEDHLQGELFDDIMCALKVGCTQNTFKRDDETEYRSLLIAIPLLTEVGNNRNTISHVSAELKDLISSSLSQFGCLKMPGESVMLSDQLQPLRYIASLPSSLLCLHEQLTEGPKDGFVNKWSFPELGREQSLPEDPNAFAIDFIVGTITIQSDRAVDFIDALIAAGQGSGMLKLCENIEDLADKNHGATTQVLPILDYVSAIDLLTLNINSSILEANLLENSDIREIHVLEEEDEEPRVVFLDQRKNKVTDSSLVDQGTFFSEDVDFEGLLAQIPQLCHSKIDSIKSYDGLIVCKITRRSDRVLH